MSEDTPVETEVETVETEVKPAKVEKVAKPKIRDTEDYTLELRKENERLRKTLEEQATARAEEMTTARLEQLKADTEEKATAKAERMVEKRLAEIEEAARARLVKSEIRAHAMRAGVIDFDDLYDILQRRGLGKIEFDDDGEITNAGAIVAEMKQSKAHLFAGVNTTSVERAPMTSETPKVEKVALMMSDEEYREARAKLKFAR